MPTAPITGINVDAKVNAFKLVAYSAMALSLASVLAVSITLPLLQHFVRSLRWKHSQGREMCQVWMSGHSLVNAFFGAGIIG